MTNELVPNRTGEKKQNLGERKESVKKWSKTVLAAGFTFLPSTAVEAG